MIALEYDVFKDGKPVKKITTLCRDKDVDVILYVGDDEEKIVYGDVDFQIDKNFIKIIAHRKDKDFITIYSVKYIHHLKIRPKGKIEELFESEVK